MSLNADLSRATALCESLAEKDFGPTGRRVYLVPFSRVAHLSDKLSGGCVFGWTGDFVDILLQHWLESQGQWKGRGFCAVLRDDLLPRVKTLEDREVERIAKSAANYQPDAGAAASVVGEPSTKRAKLVTLSNVIPQPVRWLWRPRFALGKL